MCDDIAAVGEAGAAGVVVGALTPDGDFDPITMQRLVTAAADTTRPRNLTITFHRCGKIMTHQATCESRCRRHFVLCPPSGLPFGGGVCVCVWVGGVGASFSCGSVFSLPAPFSPPLSPPFPPFPGNPENAVCLSVPALFMAGAGAYLIWPIASLV